MKNNIRFKQEFVLVKIIVLLAIIAVLLFSSTGCKKGIIFDKEMVIGDWRSWELYDGQNVWYWTFTDDSVLIYRNSPGIADSLIYEQADWNTKTFDINIFPTTDPVDSIGNPNWFIDIAKYHRSYLVLQNDQDNHSFSLTRIN